ncbi:MAG TPA: class I SAM-dependent methyltransferase [Gaiellaceae bacterium]|nr:class I SAM-dependent methyltransferase [Gaiellaceae bacterium]
MSLHDPAVVRAQYETEEGLAARKAAYANADGPNAPQLVFEAVAAVGPSRYLEVGCGEGELAARVQDELGCEVIAIDQSERMVERTRARGVNARVGDVQQLPFGDGEFDCAVAAWMLYHVPDIERALAELLRVLVAGGRLVAVTNYSDHLRELKEFVGAPPRSAWHFPGEDGERLLRRWFSEVDVRDVGGTVTFADREAVLTYVRASVQLFGGAGEVPELDQPLVVRRRPVIFVAKK